MYAAYENVCTLMSLCLYMYQVVRLGRIFQKWYVWACYIWKCVTVNVCVSVSAKRWQSFTPYAPCNRYHSMTQLWRQRRNFFHTSTLRLCHPIPLIYILIMPSQYSLPIENHPLRHWSTVCDSLHHGIKLHGLPSIWSTQHILLIIFFDTF